MKRNITHAALTLLFVLLAANWPASPATAQTKAHAKAHATSQTAAAAQAAQEAAQAATRAATAQAARAAAAADTAAAAQAKAAAATAAATQAQAAAAAAAQATKQARDADQAITDAQTRERQAAIAKAKAQAGKTPQYTPAQIAAWKTYVARRNAKRTAQARERAAAIQAAAAQEATAQKALAAAVAQETAAKALAQKALAQAATQQTAAQAAAAQAAAAKEEVATAQAATQAASATQATAASAPRNLFTLRANALTWIFGNIGIGAGIDLGTQWQLNIDAAYGNWNTSPGSFYNFRATTLGIETRRYFNPWNRNWNPDSKSNTGKSTGSTGIGSSTPGKSTGFYLGADLRYMHFNLMPGDTGREGNLFTAGILGGYTFNLWHPRWTLDTSIGLGYIHMSYDKYRQYPPIDGPRMLRHRTRNLFGPTNLSVSIAYRLPL